MLYTKFSDTRHVPIAEYERNSGEKSKQLVQSNNLIVDAYAPYSAQFARDVSKLNYVYACLRSVASALVRHYVGYEGDVLSGNKWEAINKKVQHYIENFQDTSHQTVLHMHLFNVAKMADFVTILYKKIYNASHDTMLKSLLRGGLSYSACPQDHFGHILTYFFFDKVPIQVFAKPEKPQAAKSDKIQFSSTQKVTITDVTEQTEHNWNALNVEFNTREKVNSYRRCFINELADIFEQPTYKGKYNGITEQDDFTREKRAGGISVKVETSQFIQITIQQPYQVLYGTTVDARKYEPSTSPATAPPTVPPPAEAVPLPEVQEEL